MTSGETATAHSAMTSFVDSFGDHVLYVGANQHVYQMYFSGGAWQNQDLSSQTGNTLAATGTGLSSFADGSGEHVLYIGTNQHVNELLFSSGTGWQNEDLTSQTGSTLLAASNTGFTNFADIYGEHVFYEGSNQHIEQLYGAEGSWQNQDLTGETGNTLASAPTALSSLVDSYGEHAFYFGSNQHVYQLYFNSSSGWQNQDLTGMTGNTVAASGSSLSSFVDSMGEHVFYEGTNQHIYSLYFSSSSGWSNNDLTAMAGGAGGVTNGSSASYSDGQGEHVFYQAGTGVYEFSWDGPAWEATNIGGPSLAQNYYVTQYSYDGLGNLLNVTQKGNPTISNSSQYRVRTFSYDSLSRLLTATNPESGTISYSYDANGNVLQKTSPAPNQTGTATQTISYCYDPINRVTGKVYAAQSCPLSSPVVSYGYDAGTNGIGHLTSLADQAGSGSYSYDALGRISTEQRTIAGVQKNLSYSYNLDNSIAKLTYPSGAVVIYTPDSAGRMLSAVDSGNNINYVTGASYGPDSSLTGFISGNSSSFSGINNSWHYNRRLQICRITALTTGNVPTSCTDSSDVGNILDLGYNLSLGNGDNGNVMGITNYKDITRSQSLTYDALNRLTSSPERGNQLQRADSQWRH